MGGLRGTTTTGQVALKRAVHTGVPKGENALHYAWSLSIFFLSANQLIINLLTR